MTSFALLQLRVTLDSKSFAMFKCFINLCNSDFSWILYNLCFLGVCVTMCQWASASSVSIWPICIVGRRCDAQQIKYHWYYIGFATNRQLRTSGGCRTITIGVKYWNMRCNGWRSALTSASSASVRIEQMLGMHGLRHTSLPSVCVCVCVTLKLRRTQNYYGDTLVGQTFEWMIPRVAISSRC